MGVGAAGRRTPHFRGQDARAPRAWRGWRTHPQDWRCLRLAPPSADSAIRTFADAPALRLGAYTVGRIEFEGCDVSGAGCLVDVKDLRPIKLPPNVAPEDNSDNRPGVIALRGTTWRSESKTAVAHAALGGGAASRKRICISDGGNAWPDGVAVAADLPQGWQVR